MPSPRLQRAVTDASAGAANAEFAASDSATGIAPGALAVALLVACLYAAFAHGAVASAAEERLQLGLAVIALAAAVAWSRRRLSLRAPGRLWLAVGLLAAFAFWSGVTVLWSVAPDRTWTECNRVMTYALVLVLAIAVGASLRNAPTRIADGLALVSLAVALSALAQKLVPGVHVSGLFSLDQTGTLPRLQEPLGYWNALALLVAFGVPCALAVVIDRRRADGLRLAAAAAATTMIVTIGFTYSRGGVLALVAALAILVALSGAYLRCLGWLAVVIAPALPVLLVGLNSHPLTATGVTLSARETAGAELVVLLAACLGVMLAGAHRLIAVERRARVSAAQARRIGRGLVGVVAVAVVAAILGGRGLTPRADRHRLARVVELHRHPHHRRHQPQPAAVGRLREPVGVVEGGRAGVQRPADPGVGRRVVRRRASAVSARHAHRRAAPQRAAAVPVRDGSRRRRAGLGALALLLAAGVAAARRPDPRSAGAAAALVAVGAAFCVHALYDWDWDIPAVTLPALIALGRRWAPARRHPARRGAPRTPWSRATRAPP